MVPNGWDYSTLESLCDADSPITYGVLKPGEYVNNGVPLLQIKDLLKNLNDIDSLHRISPELDQEYKRSKIKENDILISLVGTVGRIGLVPKELDGTNIHRNLGRIRTKYFDFLLHYLNSDIAKNRIGLSSSGSSQSALNLSVLRALKVPVPPLPEQQKIATILGSWDKAISTTERLIDNSKQQKKALMQQLLTGKKRLLDDSGKPFEGEWEEIKFGNCINHFGGTALEKHVSEGATHHFISIGNYSMDGKYVDKGQRVALNEKTSAKLLQKDELVMVLNDKTKTGDIIGSTILIDEDNKYIYNQRSERIIPKKDIHITFFWFLLNSSKFRAEVFNRSQGGTQIYINFSSVKTIQVKLPPILEQQKIAAVLINANEESQLLEQQLADLKQEKKALMQQLLTGKRRVKTDKKEIA